MIVTIIIVVVVSIFPIHALLYPYVHTRLVYTRQSNWAELIAASTKKYDFLVVVVVIVCIGFFAGCFDFAC